MTTTHTFPYEDIELAYTVSGNGPALILLHGWPFHKASFRKLLPLLEPHFTCYALDAAGMGESGWSRHTNFTFQAHAERVRAFADRMKLQKYSVVGHDTGGTIARLLGVSDKARVGRIVAMDTEMPGHFPSSVTQLQWLFARRWGRALMKRLLGFPGFIRAQYTKAGFFADPRFLDDEFMSLFVEPLSRSDGAFMGQVNYLAAVDRDLVVGLDRIHAQIEAPLLFIWGTKDRVFPLRHAKAMAADMGDRAELAIVDKAGFLAHEERPDEVARHIVSFLGASAPVRLAGEAR